MSVFFDSLVSGFISFMISLAVFNYHNLNYPANLFFALLLGLGTFLILVTVLKRKSEKQIKTKQDKLLFQDFCNQLCCSTPLINLNLIEQCLKKAGYNAINQQNHFKIEENKVCVFGIFSFDKISSDMLINCYKQTPEGYKTAIICTSLSPDALTLASNLTAKIEIVDISKLFLFLKENDMLPPITVKLTRSKKRLRDLIKQSFARKRCGHFFYVGTIMLAFSFFVFYPKYYLILGTLFCAFGLTCLLYGKKT